MRFCGMKTIMRSLSLGLTWLLLCATVWVGARADMLLLGAGGGAVGGVTAFGLTYIATAGQGSPSGGTCDVGTVSFGATDPTRQIIVTSGARFTGTTPAISSISVGANSASAITGASAAGSVGDIAAIWIVSLPSGASGDITITYSQTVLRCQASVFSLVGSTATWDNPGSASSGTTASSVSSSGLSIATGGGAIGTATSNAAGTIGSTTNLTQQDNLLIAASTTLYQTGLNTSSTGATTFTVNFGTSQSNFAGAFATFHP